MELQELLNKVNDSKKKGKTLITGSLRVFLPNGKKVLSTNDTKELKFSEDDPDLQMAWHPARPRVTNYYYINRIDQPGWKYIGESDDWLNKCEVSIQMDILDGPGIYHVKGVAYSEDDNSIYYSTDTCTFEIQ